jgi:hypothetical protein
VAAVVGVLAGALLVFLVTASIAQNRRPDLRPDAGSNSSLRNNVEYGAR